MVYFSKRHLEFIGEPLGDMSGMDACRRSIYYGGGKGDSPDAPNYEPLANASAEAARLGAELGRDQLDESRRQNDLNRAIAAPVVAAQLGLMKSQQEQGDEYYNYMKDTFRPVEKGLVADAEAFNEADAKERFARSAAADIEGAQANQEAQQGRAMAAMGVNPNSGKFAALKSQTGVLNAAQRAGATSNARVQADDIGWAKRMSVTGLGRGLPAAAKDSYGTSVSAGNSAVGNNAQAGNSMVAGMNAGTGTIMQGKTQQVSGLGGILSSQTSAYANGQPTDNTGALIGAAGGVAAAFI